MHPGTPSARLATLARLISLRPLVADFVAESGDACSNGDSVLQDGFPAEAHNDGGAQPGSRAPFLFVLALLTPCRMIIPPRIAAVLT